MPRTKPTIEARILAALRVDARQHNGPQTIAQLHRRPGLTKRRTAEIRAACLYLVVRQQVSGTPVYTRCGWMGAYQMPFGWVDADCADAPCDPAEVPSRI